MGLSAYYQGSTHTTSKQRMKVIQERVEETLKKVGRKDSVVLIAAVKGRSTSDILAAIQAGISHIGENIVQEMERHQEEMKEQDAGYRAQNAGEVVWHFIGRVQRNKIPRLLRQVQWIQTLSSFRHAVEMEKRLALENRFLPVLVEVNVGGESTKGGVLPEELRGLVDKIGSACPHLLIKGLMVIPPVPKQAEDSRPFFARTRQLRDSLLCLERENISLQHLSMGMSQDFLVAIEEGATMVRLGRILFEKEAFERWGSSIL